MSSSNSNPPRLFDLNDFRLQILEARRHVLGRSIARDIADQAEFSISLNAQSLEDDVRRTLGIIDSMTAIERAEPGVIDVARRRRIAAGAGVAVADVESLLAQFEKLRAFIKRFSLRAFAPDEPPAPPVNRNWMTTEDRLRLFSTWNRNLALWEFVADV
jgi:signal recognition particle GTPase